jgi:uncharacterized SAM-binding protein YcdF (DUF218 family)
MERRGRARRNDRSNGRANARIRSASGGANGLGLAKSRRRPRRRRLGKLILLAVILGCVWIAYVQWRIASIEEQPFTGRAEVGIVLGAALWNGEPSPALRERLDHALKLYGEGRFDTFIVTGGYDHPGAKLSEAEGMQRYLTAKGIPEDRILMENAARSTYENLVFSRNLMGAHGYRKAVIVTHAYHGARALDIARFLKYEDPVVSAAESRVLNMAWHRARETLAFTKWQLDKLLIRIGWME